MDYTIIEINKHKNNISNLSTKLLNTFNINEEIFINNEIKKETEILSSLLNIKMNSMMNPMNNNVINNVRFQHQMAQMQAPHMQQAFQNMQNQIQNQFEQPIKNSISIIFRRPHSDDGKIQPPIMVKCYLDDKISDVIKQYRDMADDRDMTKKFVFNAITLNPSLTVAESGMTNNCNIFVIVTKGIKGG